MKYEPPIARDLGGRATAGQSPLACLTGTSVVGFLCGPGGSDAACDAGTSGFYFAGDDCRPGGTPSINYSCLMGGSADWECAGGLTPGVFGPCTAGPSV